MAAHFKITRGVDRSARDCFRIHGPGEHPPNHFDHGGVQAQLASFDKDVKSLIKLACADKDRFGNQNGDPRTTASPPIDIRPHSVMFRRLILGGNSLAAHFPFEETVVLEPDEYCAALPLELMQDRYAACLDHSHRWAQVPPEAPAEMSKCPEGHSVIVGSAPLALLRQLGIKPGPEAEHRRDVTATKALVFGCPDDGENDISPWVPHLTTLEKELGKYYTVTAAIGPNATRDALIAALSDPAFGVVYIYAHGELAENRRVARILTAMAHPVTHLDLPDRLPGNPFVFLNSCWLGRTAWSETSGVTDSFAQELLRRGASAVVAPLCKVVTNQAAEAAVLFFEEAIGTTIGRAMERVRKDSYNRYDKCDQPDLSWFAYRLYGDPESCLPARTWTSDGTLIEDAFTPEGLWLLRTMQSGLDGQQDHRARNINIAQKLVEAAGIVLGSPAGQIAGYLAAIAGSVTPENATATVNEPHTGGRPKAAGIGRKLLRSPDYSIRLLLRNSLGMLIRRDRKLTRLNLRNPPGLGIFDLLDACPMALFQPDQEPIAIAPGEKLWPEEIVSGFRDDADAKITGLLRELQTMLIRRGITSGAAFIIQQIELNVHRCASMAELEDAVLDVFLAHFLVGNAVLAGKALEIQRLREMLRITGRGRGERIKRKGDLMEFLDYAFERATAGAGDARPHVTEQTLYLFFREEFRNPKFRPTPEAKKAGASKHAN